MPCYYPLTAWRSADLDDIKNGKHKLVFRADLGFPGTKMQLACGQCSGCRLDKARQWAIRCLHEASLHKDKCFLTLTYNPQSLPPDGSLNVRDMQLFLKRLRKHYPDRTIRFFQCGEYGDLLNRPHHHCLLFGLDFADKLLLRGGKKNKLYESKTLTSLWGLGHCSIGDVTFDSACYVARYVLKKFTGDKADEYYQGRKPEYTTMSRRPGIGKLWYDKYKNDLYTDDKCVISSTFIARPPKYYDNLYDLDNPQHLKQLKRKRSQRAKENQVSAERLQQMEEYQTLQQQKIPRPFEDHE
nr:MAG: replication initiator protein [Microvirus sp.]